MESFTTIPPNPPATEPVDAPVLQRFAPDLPADKLMWSDTLPGGGHWSYLMPRGSSLRLVALGEGANLSALLYAARNPLERYNLPDTVKALHTAHYTRGHVLMSDMGRALASITRDDVGWHDPFGALLDDTAMETKYGAHRYEAHRNAMHRSGKTGLLIEIGKHGLGRRDLIAPVNFFTKLTVDDEGGFHFVPGHAKAGATVELRFEMDVLLALSSAPHPLNPSTDYAPAAIGLAAWRSGPAPADDYCRNFRPENARALHNAEMLAL
ncbi:MAG: urea carboxylase-associated family protein [Rhizobacter sp.]|nr:urea carboxylase-associated family protein [Rhizobacter sp.]